MMNSLSTTIQPQKILSVSFFCLFRQRSYGYVSSTEQKNYTRQNIFRLTDDDR